MVIKLYFCLYTISPQSFKIVLCLCTWHRLTDQAWRTGRSLLWGKGLARGRNKHILCSQHTDLFIWSKLVSEITVISKTCRSLLSLEKEKRHRGAVWEAFPETSSERANWKKQTNQKHWTSGWVSGNHNRPFTGGSASKILITNCSIHCTMCD